jgi:hypothetical protein
VLVATLATGCGPGRLSLTPSDGAVDADDYPHLLERWTRSGRAYQQFESRIFVHATYCSLPFRQGYVARRAAFLGWPPARAKQEMQRERDDHAEYHTFVLAVFTHQWSWNDLDSEHSIWQLWLEGTPGRRVPPASVQRVRRKLPEVRALFPHATRFFEVYRVRFPKADVEGRPVLAPSPQKITVLVTGSRGSVALHWQVAP